MDRKSHPFSSLTEAELDAIMDRARQERAKAIAVAFAWLRWRIAAMLAKPFGRPSPVDGRAIHNRARGLRAH